MADLDKIFTSDLTEDEKKAKSLFGKLLVSLRKSNQMRLYSLLANVSDTKYSLGKLQLTVSDKSSYQMLTAQNDLSLINNELNKIENGLIVNFDCVEKVEFSLEKFKTFLKEEFGKILTIK